MEDLNKTDGQTQPGGADKDKKQEGGASGVSFVSDQGQTKPPLEGQQAPGAGELPPELAEIPPGSGGKTADELPSKEPIEISVDFVEITLGSLGTIAFQFTGYSPFQFTQKELQTIANLAAACEIKAPAQIQLIIGLVTLMGAKVGGYMLWRRADKPPIHYDADGNMIVGNKPEDPAAAVAVVKK